LHGKVIRVLDGDTVEIRQGAGGADQNVRIRMLGIDAPESKMPFGETCRRKLADFVAGHEVEVRTQAAKDRYGRTVGQIWFEHRDINLAMVQDGCAWHYRQYAKRQAPADRRAYARAEVEAHAAKRGLWSASYAQPPWDFRKQKRRR
jgi:endonuclease YncB( thermonuclease family)